MKQVGARVIKSIVVNRGGQQSRVLQSTRIGSLLSLTNSDLARSTQPQE
jgi:hypothetical protein